jgi:hypothetical protein
MADLRPEPDPSCGLPAIFFCEFGHEAFRVPYLPVSAAAQTLTAIKCEKLNLAWASDVKFAFLLKQPKPKPHKRS